ncbi:folylpolyglutamate synthase/dihydrofolate synthase family protein [Flavobacterium sp.]|uniref:bifunctional folylpolyglutamate synthase/dihydrofolate synthase n=1 Tax=Flavobacterium sp. TaxID=239 RepID=UPI0035278EA8
MNYEATTNWLFNQLPMYQNQGKIAYKADLSNTFALVNHLKNPQKYFKTIHVAGTNGKGSTSSMLASIFQEAGYKVGLFTSPHLKDYRERIKINGKKIERQFVVDFVTENKDFFEENALSFFEMTTGLAFSYFAKKHVDIAIIEVGLGGRLDATNVIEPVLSIITNIGFDHQQILGNTLQKIALEKAGIIKNHVPVVIGEYTTETKNVFEEVAQEKHAEIYFAQEHTFPNYATDLRGNYQKANKATVLTAVSLLQTHFSLPKDAITRGFKNVVANTGLLGRWHILNEEPLTICDTAHNAHGLKIVMEQLIGLPHDNLHIVLGVVNDKDIDEILAILPKEANYYFCKPKNPRALNEKELQKKAAMFSLSGSAYSTVSRAYKKAKEIATKKDVIYIGGSNFVVAEVV